VLSRTENHYRTFGNPWVIAPKLVWDATLNHYGMVFLMVREKLTDLELMRAVSPDLDRLARLNIRMQGLFREWMELERRPLGAVGARQPAGPMVAAIIGIAQEYDDDVLRTTVANQARTAEAMAVALFHRAAGVLAEPPDRERPINPYAIGLRPEAWESDGLFEEPGLTYAEAIAAAGGVENAWLDPSLAEA
jgi:hypothetical protein